MACRYTYKGKTYEVSEFDDLLRAMSPAEAAQFMPGVKANIPPAPFVTKTSAWLDLALKRVITMAVRGGYDKVAFVTGEQSAERYDLSKQADDLRYGDGMLVALKGGSIVVNKEAKPEDLPDLVGKEIADRLLKAPEMPGNGYKRLTGLDLKVGGEGMKAFYNTIVPNAAKALAKKLGGEWGTAGIAQPNQNSNKYLGDQTFDPDRAELRNPGPGVWQVWADGKLRGNGNFSSEAAARAFIETGGGGTVSQQPALNITMPMRQKVQDEGLPLFSNRVQPDGRIDNIEAYHFSQSPRKTLSTSFFGTGLRGSDRDEIKAYKDQRVGKRLSFYVDKGTGVRPESGVGGVAHRVTLSNVYDSDKDPQGLKRGANKRAFEAAVLDAGFGGYLTRLEGTQPGQVIMLGEQTFKPEILGPTSSITASQRVEPMPQKANDWDTLDTGSADQMRVKMERLQSKPSWADFEFRIQDGQLQARRLEDVAASNRVTDTAKFKYWFGDSKVVDAKGEPLVVYHGTRTADRLAGGQGFDDFGAHFGTAAQANARAKAPENTALIPAYLSISNPARFVDNSDWTSKIKKAKKAGNDGIVYLNRYEGVERSVGDGLGALTDDQFAARFPEARDSWIAFRPEQIKSAIGNSGAFDRNDPDITASQRVEPMPQKANDWDTLDTGSADQMRVKMERLQSKPSWADFEFRIQDGQLQARRLEDVAASNRVTDTAKFKYWFGDSKVVDASGQPLAQYHSTPNDIADFQRGSHFGTAAAANERAAFRGEEGARVMPVYLRIENPLRVSDAEASDEATLLNAIKRGKYNDIDLNTASRKGAIRAAEQAGYDGFVYKNRMEDRGADSWVTFRPDQIKSAIGNSGAFDPNDPDITAANRITTTMGAGWKDGLGRFQFGPGAALYRMVANFANKVLEPIGMKPIDEDLGRAIRKMKLEISKAQARTADVAVKLKELSEDERKMISDVIEGELKAGVTPPQRVLDIAASMVSIMREQSAELVRLEMLTPEAVGRWDGKYLPRFYVKDLKSEGKEWMRAAKQLLGRQKTMQGIGGSSLKARGIFENIPTADLPNWEAQGWEQRDPKFTAGDTETVVWRDYTRQERDDMNEVRDAMFRFVMGYMRSQRDIALGRLFERLAVDVAKKAPPKGEPWVQVPDTKIDGTYAPRYGKLAGLFVPREVLDHLKAADSAQTNEILKIYRKAMSMWKEGKVVLNPVSHANNIVSNLTMAHFAGVSYWDQHKYVGAIRDLVKKDPLVKEAEDAGLFGGTFNSEELMDNMPDELKQLAGQVESKAAKAVDGVWTALSFWLRKPMGKAYEAEDTFFRYLIYRDARKRGMQPDDAVDYAQRYIFAYDDLPATARGIRDFALPFFAYTYKAIPALAHTVTHYPWRAAAPAAVFAGINTMGYIFAVGATDDEDDWYELIKRYITDKDFSDKVKALEAQEQESLPEWMKGYSALGTPKSIRLGMDDVTNLPLFLDVARIFPGGDLLDANNNAGGIPLLQPITPSHPILGIYGAMMLNKDGYFGKEIVDKNDTSGEAFEKRAKWAWGQLAPAIAIGNYHFDRGMNVIAQVTGEPIDLGITEYLGYGRDGLPVQPSLAAMQTVGIKARPIDLEKSDAIKQSQTEKMIRDLQTEIRRLQRIDSNLPVSSKLNERQIELNRTKIDRLREGLTVDGEEKK